MIEHDFKLAAVKTGAPLYREVSAPNIERFIGTAQIPMGVAGPVDVHGDHASGRFHIPMATTEGTLVASTTRGMKVINESGGARVKSLRTGGIQRTPVFEFHSIDDASEFAEIINRDWSWLVPVMESTTTHGKVIDIHAWQMNRYVCVRTSMNPGDASGQNMVSISTQQAVLAILKRFPSVKRHFLEGGFCGEKVASNASALLGRGKSVSVSVSIPEAVMRDITRADLADLPVLHQIYSTYSMWGGNNNSHCSLANTLTAMYIACGQDVATLPESHQAQNSMSYDADAKVLHWEVHIANIVAGTIGGGTGLPTQREALDIMGCYGAGKIDKFVELCAVAALANEISFWGAICSQEWIDAHASLKQR